MGNAGGKRKQEKFTYTDTGMIGRRMETVLLITNGQKDEGLSEALETNLQRLIVYAKSADTSLQREVAEKLANEAVKRK